MKLRIPGWARGEGVRVEVNGEEWGGCRAAATHLAGSTCTVRRSFAAGAALLCARECPCHDDLHVLTQEASHVLQMMFAACGLSAGDVVRLELPMSVRAERVEDDRPEYSSLHVSI